MIYTVLLCCAGFGVLSGAGMWAAMFERTRIQIRGQGRICPTAAKAAVCHRPAPLAALVLLGLISPAQGQAPETPAACAANKGVCPTADNGGLSVIK